MAAAPIPNKFATNLYRNTNRLTVVLVYAALEWTLIALLLFNSILSYLIIKFSDFFGLHRPCILCSRLDHLFEPPTSRNSYRSLVCEAHAGEISQLGYCSVHRKLVESREMCEDCPGADEEEDYDPIRMFVSNGGRLAVDDVWFLSGASGFESREKVESVAAAADGVDEGKLELVEVEENDDDLSFAVAAESKEVFAQPQQHLDFIIDQGDCHLIPVEFSGPKSDEVGNGEDLVFEFENYELIVEERFSSYEKVPLLSIPEQDEEEEQEEDEEEEGGQVVGNDGLVIEEELEQNSTAEAASGSFFSYELVLEDRFSFDENVPLLSTMEQEQESEEKVVEEDGEIVSFSVVNWDDLVAEDLAQSDTAEPISTLGNDDNGDEESSETIKEVELEHDDDDTYANEDPVTTKAEKEMLKTAQTEANAALKGSAREIDEMEKETDFQGSMPALEEVAVEHRTITVEGSELATDIEIEEESIPVTPTNSIDGFHHLHNVLLSLRRREDGVEGDSLDGSVFGSDLEAGDGVLTMEKLKSIVRDERKVLNALLTELEEERNASSVAANQSMAMITRLQEEKAAMQMEAFQYQRMMEEQADFDREAIEMLNELMLKRERENAELEEELEACRQMLEDYEVKEMLMMKTRKEDDDDVLRSGDSLTTSSSGDVSDSDSSQSIELNLNGTKRLYSSGHDSSQKTPADTVLEQLRGLEERLCLSTSDDEEQHLEASAPIHHAYEDEDSSNGHHDKIDPSIEANGVTNGHHHEETNGIRKKERKVVGTKAKRLLPLFDAATDVENGDGMKLSMSTEEEVDHVYQKLQGVEEDREFLKHCISSLRNGDKGIELLKQILQNLCDLRMENGA